MREFKANLSVSSLDTLIKELEAYRDALPEKCKTFCELLAKEGIAVAKGVLQGSRYAGYVAFSMEMEPGVAGCTAVMTATETGKITLPYNRYGKTVTVDVSPLLMSEYGSGIHAIEGWRGTFPNPNRHGESHGLEGHWSWKDLSGKWHSSTGEEPKREIFLAAIEMREKIAGAARQAFGEGGMEDSVDGSE